ncbi:uncharacterized protein LOC124149867 [Haliotis rufescens]|uniref:uncharacterized protein LOC124149867 n=1 Tax=Haliotis rufescens TaxID=6454 RepID=UPI00201F7B0C|nr:uncharacterized protein LOC124149867 [Haliotis rufescens]
MDPGSPSQEDPGQGPSVDQSQQPSIDPYSWSQEDDGEQPSIDLCSHSQEHPGQNVSLDQSDQPSIDPHSRSKEDPDQHSLVDQSHQPSMDPGSQSQEDPCQHSSVDQSYQPSIDPHSQSQENHGQQPSVDQSHQPSVDPHSQSQENHGQQPSVDQSHQSSTDPGSPSQEDPSQRPSVDHSHQPSVDPCSQSSVDQSHQPSIDAHTALHEGDRVQGRANPNTLPGPEITVQRTSEEYQYDAVLEFAEEDEDLAMEIQSEMNHTIVVGNRKARVCLRNHPQFGGSTIDRPTIMREKCRYMFLILTRNTESDNRTCYVKSEALGSTLLSSKCQHFVIPLHTKPTKERKYDIPVGLAHVQAYEWFLPLDRCQRKIQELFNHHAETEEHQVRAYSTRQGTMNRNIMRQCSREATGTRNKENTNTLGDKSTPARDTDVSPDLRRIIHQTNMILQDWEEKLFYKTKTTREAKDVLMTKGSLFLVGRSGDGKTSTVYHILTEFRKDKSTYQPYIVYEPEDMKHIPPANSIVFVDDILGRSSFSFALLEKWKLYFRPLVAYVKAGHMYFISTSPNFVRDECLSFFDDIPLLSNVIDTTSNENSLRAYEKEAMLTEYLDRYKVCMEIQERSAALKGGLIIGFPQCCQYFVTNQDAQRAGHKFFLHPFEILRSQITKLKETDRIAYMVLVLILFNNGGISSRYLDPYCTDNPPALLTVIEACGIPKDTPKIDIKSAVIKLVRKKYLVYNKQEGLHVFSHQSLYDAVCRVFGDESVEKLLEFAPSMFLVDYTSVFDDSLENSGIKIQILREHHKTFINRIIQDIQVNNFKLLEHSAFKRKDFVGELFENITWIESLQKLLLSDESVKHLINDRTLYCLTAASKCQPLLLQLVGLLGSTDGEKQKLLLHDILEGSCCSGDLELFDEVVSRDVTPCSNCALVAAESSVDNPYIMRRLQKKMPPEYETMETLVDILVGKKRLQTLRHVSPHVNWSHFKTPKRKRKLLLSACSSGEFGMFQLLTGPTYIGDAENKHELLMTAVGGGSKDIVEYLLTRENKDQVDKMHRSVLHHACLKGSADLCQFLLSMQVDMSRIDKIGATAFHLACKNRDISFIERLLSIGFTITVTDIQTTKRPIRLSPLHMASRNDKGWQMVQLLIEKGPTDVDMLNFQDSDGFTPMHIASQQPHGSSMIQELMKHKANLSQLDSHGRIPLHCAAKECIYKNIEVLLDSRADVNAKDASRKTPLHYLLAKQIQNEDEIESQSDSVKRLLQNGADVCCEDKDGNSPIHVAAASISNTKTFQQLLAKTGDVPKLNNAGLTPLHLLLRPDTPLENVKLLVETYPSLLGSETKNGKSVLHVAFQNQIRYNIILYLLQEKCSDHTVNWEHVDIKEVFCRFTSEQIVHILRYVTESMPSSVMPNMMHVLCEADMADDKWTQGMKLLHSNTADLDLDVQGPRGSTALHKVADSPVKMNYLLKKKCDVNIRDQNGNTPLHIAVQKRNAKGVDILLSSGADVSAVNKRKETALLKAAKIISKCVIHWEQYIALLESTDMLINFLQFYGTFFHFGLKDQETEKCSDVNIISRIISSLIERSSPVNEPDINGNTAVHYAVWDINILEQLVSAKANLDQKNYSGVSCLHVACMSNENTDVINYLLDQGVSLCTTSAKLNITPLHVGLLCKMNDHTVLKRLYDSMVKSSQSNCEDFLPFLHVSACCSSKDLVQLFIDLDRNKLLTQDKFGYLPIHHAVAAGDLEVVMLLAEAMKTATHRSEKACHSRTVSTMQSGLFSKRGRNALPSRTRPTAVRGQFDRGRPPLGKRFDQTTKGRGRSSQVGGQTTQVKEEPTPITGQSTHFGPKTTDGRPTSSRCKKQQKMKGLSEKEDNQCAHGKPKDMVDSRGIQVQDLHGLVCRLKPRCDLILVAAQYSNVDVIGFLLKQGWNVNLCDKDGNTPLHAAVQSVNYENAEYLLKKGADVECINRNGLTPLQITVQNTFPKFSINIIRLLLSNGASVGSCTKHDRQNLLHIICKDELISQIASHVNRFNLSAGDLITQMLSIPRLLIHNGCHVNAIDSQGQTPLHLAAEANNALYVDILLDNEGNIDALDSQGRTPLQLALENYGKVDLIPFSTALCLVERSANPHAIVRCGVTPLDILLGLGKGEILMNEEFKQICHLLGIWEEVKEQE